MVWYQAAFTVYDTLTIPPPGKIYSIDANGVELKLHLHCFGNGMGNKTVVFAHGGGSNSAAMLALAEVGKGNLLRADLR